MQYQMNSPIITADLLDEEVVIVNLEQGFYYSLVEVGATIWELINCGYKVEEITDYISKQYNNHPKDDVENLVNELLKENLIRHQNTTKTVREMKTPTLPYKPPQLEKYDDMQKLLLLDPIHEVNDFGWPHREETVEV